MRVLEDEAGDRYAKNFLRWQEVDAAGRADRVVLIGGATGVGKSTIATQIAARLGIVRVVPTDADPRGHARPVLPRADADALHVVVRRGRRAARAARRGPRTRSSSGFREQTAAVAVGIRALIERAAVEGTSAIIEGAHVVPGLPRPRRRSATASWSSRWSSRSRTRTCTTSHFVARSADSRCTAVDRYIDEFDNIRKVQKYIKSQALSHDWPVIPNYNLDQTIAAVIDLVVEKAARATGTPSRRAPEQPSLEQIRRRSTA